MPRRPSPAQLAAMADVDAPAPAVLRCSICQRDRPCDDFNRAWAVSRRARGYREYRCRSCLIAQTTVERRARARVEGRPWRPRHRDPETRRCSRCGEVKPADLFPLVKQHTTLRDGTAVTRTRRQAYCPDCRRIVNKQCDSYRRPRPSTPEVLAARRESTRSRVAERRAAVATREAERLGDHQAMCLGLLRRARKHGVPIAHLVAEIGVTATSFRRWSDPRWVRDSVRLIEQRGAKPAPLRRRSERQVTAFLLRLADDPGWWQRNGRARP